MEIINKIKKLLEQTLNVKFKTKPSPEDSVDEVDRISFIRMIKHLEKLAHNETILLNQSGIDITSIVSPYWEMIEEIMAMTWTDELSVIIWWYVFERKDPVTGDVKPWEDIDGTEYKFETAEEFYEYLSKHFDL